MEYRNIKTGAVINTFGDVKGDDWELVKAPKSPISEVIEEAPKKVKRTLKRK